MMNLIMLNIRGVRRGFCLQLPCATTLPPPCNDSDPALALIFAESMQRLLAISTVIRNANASSVVSDVDIWAQRLKLRPIFQFCIPFIFLAYTADYDKNLRVNVVGLFLESVVFHQQTISLPQTSHTEKITHTHNKEGWNKQVWFWVVVSSWHSLGVVGFFFFGLDFDFVDWLIDLSADA